jgi:catechol 2,3-dioxygenase-like lactoylglutathione lyase family enzyme
LPAAGPPLQPDGRSATVAVVSEPTQDELEAALRMVDHDVRDCGTQAFAPVGFDRMALKRMDNMGIVVEDLSAAIDFFRELGMELEGQGMVEGEWAGRVTGLGDQRVEVAMMRTPDGHNKLELSRFLEPAVIADHRTAPVNALGYLRVMFAVDDIDDTLDRLRRHGAELVGDVVRYGDTIRLCYIRGPEGLLIGLAEA